MAEDALKIDLSDFQIEATGGEVLPLNRQVIEGDVSLSFDQVVLPCNAIAVLDREVTR